MIGNDYGDDAPAAEFHPRGSVATLAQPASSGGASIEDGGRTFRWIVGCSAVSMTTMFAILFVVLMVIVSSNFGVLTGNSSALNTLADAWTNATAWGEAEMAKVHALDAHNLTLASLSAYVGKVLETVDSAHYMTTTAQPHAEALFAKVTELRATVDDIDHVQLLADFDDVLVRLRALLARFEEMGITFHVGT